MRGDRRGVSNLQGSRQEGQSVDGDDGDHDDIVKFSPGFSVYVLPPDSVCLYSEHRKFFLHGDLYCLLATAIGDGKRYRRLVHELSSDVPADTVREAVKRLVDRRFVVRSNDATSSTVEAYWASLGLPPGIAQKNLGQTRVVIQSVDAPGAVELAAALGELDVRAVKRGGNLAITLVGDYLEPRLEQLNRKHLADSTRWLIAQPSGIFPLVGPVFRPGESACWQCLAERMQRNREIKAFLQRKEAHCVAASPLAKAALGQNGIQLAALEIAKAIATDFRTDLRDHIVSLDLLGSTIARHYVAARPQCPACGRAELRDPARAPRPIELEPGGKLVMTSGGYRAVQSAATVARYRKNVSPLTGVVSRLERIEVDLPLNTNWLAVHNFSSRPDTINELKGGLGGGSYGKGSSVEQGEASALMEAIERYSGIYQGDEIRLTRRLADFPVGDAIHANDILLYSAAQQRDSRAAPPGEADLQAAPAFDAKSEIEWSPVWSLRDKRFRYVPTAIAYFSYRDPAGNRAAADSNGCAAGNTLEEAIVQGFLELVERDAYAIWWYNRVPRPQVDLDRFDDPYIRDLRAQFAATGRRVWVLDMTSDLGVPSFVALAHWMKGSAEQIEFGSGSHFDARIAMLRALTELNQFLSIGLMAGDSASVLEETVPFRLQEHHYLSPLGKPIAPPDLGARFRDLDKRDQVTACVELVKNKGLDVLVLDQTRADIEVPVVRVIVPGLRHFYRRFAPGRLYDVPVDLGWRSEPITESDLNPLMPRT